MKITEKSPHNADNYKPGDPWYICDSCGLKYRRSDMRRNHEGFFVCPKDYEQRHPQEFVRGKVDKIRVVNPRPDQDPVFITTPVTRDDL